MGGGEELPIGEKVIPSEELSHEMAPLKPPRLNSTLFPEQIVSTKGRIFPPAEPETTSTSTGLEESVGQAPLVTAAWNQVSTGIRPVLNVAVLFPVEA